MQRTWILCHFKSWSKRIWLSFLCLIHGPHNFMKWTDNAFRCWNLCFRSILLCFNPVSITHRADVNIHHVHGRWSFNSYISTKKELSRDFTWKMSFLHKICSVLHRCVNVRFLLFSFIVGAYIAEGSVFPDYLEVTTAVVVSVLSW